MAKYIYQAPVTALRSHLHRLTAVSICKARLIITLLFAAASSCLEEPQPSVGSFRRSYDLHQHNSSMTLLPPFIFSLFSYLKPKSQSPAPPPYIIQTGGCFLPSPPPAASCVVGERLQRVLFFFFSAGGRLLSAVSALAADCSQVHPQGHGVEEQDGCRTSKHVKQS